MCKRKNVCVYHVTSCVYVIVFSPKNVNKALMYIFKFIKRQRINSSVTKNDEFIVPRHAPVYRIRER